MAAATVQRRDLLAMLAATVLSGAATPGHALTGCSDPAALEAKALAGTWRIGSRQGIVGNRPYFPGVSQLLMRESGGRLAMLVAGHRIDLFPRQGTDGLVIWPRTPQTRLSGEDVAAVFGCPISEMPRWRGRTTELPVVTAQSARSFHRVPDGSTRSGPPAQVDWQLIAASDSWVLVQWSVRSSPPRFGYFQLVR